MRRLLVLAAVAAAVGGLAVSGTAKPSGAGGTPAAASFRLADGSAGCTFAPGVLACRTASSSRSLVLERDGDSRAADEIVTWNDETPRLGRTASWWHGGFACRVRTAALVCSASGGRIVVGASRVASAAQYP